MKTKQLPQIDIYILGDYAASTRKYSTLRQALEAFSKEYGDDMSSLVAHFS